MAVSLVQWQWEGGLRRCPTFLNNRPTRYFCKLANNNGLLPDLTDLIIYL